MELTVILGPIFCFVRIGHIGCIGQIGFISHFGHNGHFGYIGHFRFLYRSFWAYGTIPIVCDGRPSAKFSNLETYVIESMQFTFIQDVTAL